MLKTIDRKAAVIFFMVVVPLIALGIFTMDNVSRFVASSERMVHTAEVLTELDKLYTALVEAETNQRTYLLTGKDAYLVAHDSAVRRISPAVSGLKSLTNDNALQQQHLAALDPVLHHRLETLEEGITLKRSGNGAEAVALVMNEKGKRLMDECRRLIHLMTAEEDRLHVLREQLYERNIQTVSTGMLWFISIDTLLLFVAYFLIRRYANERAAAEDAIRAFNANLELKVFARTAELQSSEARYRDLFENNPQPMWVYEIQTLRFLAVNHAAVRHYGYSEAEFLGMTIQDIRPPQEIDRLNELLNNPSETLNDAGIWVHRTQKGALIEVRVVSHALNYLGKPARMVLAIDVTAERRAAAEVHRLNAELEERVLLRTQEMQAANAQLQVANKELESFSYSVSHDLRAPLRAIDGFAQLALDDYAAVLGQEGQRLIEVIRTNARRMGVLIDDLLSFSRLTRKRVDAAPVEMTRLVESVLEELDPQSKPAGNSDAPACAVHLGELCGTQGDAAMLRQVWTNLVSNALKFSSHAPEPAIEIGSYTENGEAIFFVKDNGVGFDMRYSDKLFGVFQRLHSGDEFEGTGVGLAIVHRVVSRHGGRVWANSEVGNGATFFFSLPLKFISTGSALAPVSDDALVATDNALVATDNALIATGAAQSIS